MKTSIHWQRLKGLSGAELYTAIAGAADFELRKPALALELGKSAALRNILGQEGGAAVPDFERCKAFLANKYATPANNPVLGDLAAQFAEFYHTNMPELDMAWTVLFDLVDLRGSTHDHFDIIDTNAGMTWTQRAPGEPIEIRRAISENKTSVGYLEFVAGLGLLDTWLQFQQFWNIDEAIGEFIAKYYDKQAALHYALLTAQSIGINIAFSVDDVTTANAAAADILRKTRDKGYGAGAAAGFYAVTSPEKAGRLARMLTAQRGSAMVDYGTMKEPLNVRIAGVIATTYVPANDTGWYMVLPGRKLKRAVWRDLQIERARTIYVKAEDITGVGQYNAAVGDTDQIRRVLWA